MESKTVPHVYLAIAKVQAEISKQGISKDRSNNEQKYKFRGIDDVYNSLAPIIAEAGLIILPRMKSRELRQATTKNGNALLYVVVEADYDLMSTVDASTLTATVFGEAMDSGDKATNKAMSAAYKYMCLQTFCIPTEGDNDADATTHQPQSIQNTNSAQQTQPVNQPSANRQQNNSQQQQNNQPPLKLPAITPAAFDKALNRIRGGELDVADKTLQAFTLTPQQNHTLAAVHMEAKKAKEAQK